MNAPEFLKAYGLLQAVDVGASERRVPVSWAQMEAAARVSPTFAALLPYLKSDQTRDALDASRKYGLVDDGEFAGGWWLWALRNAAAYAGAGTPRQEDAFYHRLSDELLAAQRRGNSSCAGRRQPH